MEFMQRWLARLDTLLQALRPLVQDDVFTEPAIVINPTTGLPMVGGLAGVDVSGTPYAMLPESLSAPVAMPQVCPVGYVADGHDTSLRWEPLSSSSCDVLSWETSASSCSGSGWNDMGF